MPVGDLTAVPDAPPRSLCLSLQSIRGRLIALSIAILLFGLIASGTSVLLSVRSNAYALLQSQTESLANSYARVISEWVDSKATARREAAAPWQPPRPLSGTAAAAQLGGVRHHLPHRLGGQAHRVLARTEPAAGL